MELSQEIMHKLDKTKSTYSLCVKRNGSRSISPMRSAQTLSGELMRLFLFRYCASDLEMDYRILALKTPKTEPGKDGIFSAIKKSKSFRFGKYCLDLLKYDDAQLYFHLYGK